MRSPDFVSSREWFAIFAPRLLVARGVELRPRFHLSSALPGVGGCPTRHRLASTKLLREIGWRYRYTRVRLRGTVRLTEATLQSHSNGR